MRRLHWLCAIFLLLGCVKVLSVRDIPDIALGQASFYPTIEAHTDAPIVGEKVMFAGHVKRLAGARCFDDLSDRIKLLGF